MVGSWWARRVSPVPSPSPSPADNVLRSVDICQEFRQTLGSDKYECMPCSSLLADVLWFRVWTSFACLTSLNDAGCFELMLRHRSLLWFPDLEEIGQTSMARCAHTCVRSFTIMIIRQSLIVCAMLSQTGRLAEGISVLRLSYFAPSVHVSLSIRRKIVVHRSRNPKMSPHYWGKISTGCFKIIESIII